VSTTTITITTTTTKRVRKKRVLSPHQVRNMLMRALRAVTITIITRAKVTSITTAARRARKAKRASVETREVAVVDTVETTTTSESTIKMKRALQLSRMKRPTTLTTHLGDSSVEVSAVVAVHPEVAKLVPTTENSVEATEEPAVADPGLLKNIKVQVRLEKPK
jgi:hypothetical protein